MKKNLRALITITLSLILIISLFTLSQGQIRGRALYEKLRTDRNLVKFEGERFIRWTPNGTGYYKPKDNSFVKIDAETGTESSLFDDAAIIKAYNTITSKNVDKLPFRNFTFIDEGRKINFRVNTTAYVYDLETEKIISYVPEKSITGVRGRTYSEVFSPDFKNRAFIRDFNLFVADLEGRETELTTGGHTDLRKGFPDWVYPEELGQYDAFWWSLDSKKIAYMEFDEGPVRHYPIVHDIKPVPEYELQRYPKAGENNPIINFFIVDIKTKETVRIKTGLETNVYLFRGKWAPNGEFTYQRLNRWQNRIELFAVNPETGKTRLILMDEDPCYIQADFDLTFLNNNRLLWTSERSGWKEIYLYDMQGNLIKQLTDAKLPIGNIAEVDEENGWVYFTGSENRGLESHLYRVKLDGTQFTKLTKEPGSHFCSVAPGGNYYADNFSSFSVPPRYTLHKSDGAFIRELGNSTVTQEFKDLELIEPEHFTFKSADGKYDLDAIVYKPAHFDPSKSYPLILSVYGGPGSKRVFNRYIMNDGSQALAQLGFIVVSIDHRGISRRGKAFQNLMYMNLGEIELEDHVAAVKHIAQRPYVDGNRVGIFGHSYGGFMTCIAMLKAPDVFHVGVAGAPVTSWYNYDTIYTERYMRRPQDNPEGYEKSNCMNYAKNLKGHLAIHHGCVDDNVHPGNTIQLIYELLKNGKKFDLMMYPEQMHGIRFSQYGEARVDYFIEHLKPEVIE